MDNCKRCGSEFTQRNHRGRPRLYCGQQCWEDADKASRLASWGRRNERYHRMRRAGIPSKLALAARDSESKMQALLAEAGHGQSPA